MLFRNIARAMTLADRYKSEENPAAELTSAAVVAHKGKILWVGPEDSIPTEYKGHDEFDCQGMFLMPGLVECHTHLVFAGERSKEFHLRNSGASYSDILESGGGLLSTVMLTRKATEEELISSALPRLERLLAQGVTTCEIKSGYGLDLQSELKILRVIRKLDQLTPITLIPTFLGAHAVPVEHRSDRASYVDMVVKEMIPAVVEQGLARFCDVFCENVAFGLNEARRVLEAGKQAGLLPKIHAEQLAHTGACKLAADIGAVSADHCDMAEEEDCIAMAEAGVTAVLLPGATFFIGGTDFAPARMLLDRGVSVALSTDCNPGSTMTENLQLMTTFGGCMMKMNEVELARSVTIEAAKALAMQDEIGTLEPGKQADMVLMDCDSFGHVPYHYGGTHVAAVVKKGQVVFTADRGKSGR